MASTTQPHDVDWTAVIARALAFLCVRQAQIEGETLLDQAAFLQRFGIPRSETAGILGTTQKSLTELERQQTKRQGRQRTKNAPATKAVRKGRGKRKRRA